MAYLDSIVNAWFRSSDGGKSAVFCPYGAFGSCYEVSSRTARRIRRFLRVYVVVSIGIGAIAARMLGMWALAVLVILMAVYAVTISFFLRGAFPRDVAQSSSLAETTKRMGEAMGLSPAIGLLTFGLVMLIFSAIALMSGHFAVGGVGGLFAAAVTLQSVALVRAAAAARRARRR